jgi:hypothetical protein
MLSLLGDTPQILHEDDSDDGGGEEGEEEGVIMILSDSDSDSDGDGDGDGDGGDSDGGDYADGFEGDDRACGGSEKVCFTYMPQTTLVLIMQLTIDRRRLYTGRQRQRKQLIRNSGSTYL